VRPCVALQNPHRHFITPPSSPNRPDEVVGALRARSFYSLRSGDGHDAIPVAADQ
jgi:hypothetical protein